jgi:hypothetical protein
MFEKIRLVIACAILIVAVCFVIEAVTCFVFPMFHLSFCPPNNFVQQ